MFRAWLCILLSFLTVLGLMSTSFAYIELSEWAKSDIDEAEMLGILPDVFYDLNMKGNITRLEMAQLAVEAYVNLTGIEPLPNRTDYFPDTSHPSVAVAYEIGIVNGYGEDGTFRPDNLLTRQEFFQIVCNLIQVAGVRAQVPDGMDFLTNFADRSAVSGWAEYATQLMVALDVVKGTPKGDAIYLNPTGNTSRQEAIVMFLRGFKIVEEYLQSDWLTKADLEEMEKAAREENATEEAQKLIATALGFVGYPYVYGGKTPSSGFDCSGFTMYIYGQYGYPIHRIADDQATNGIAVEFNNLQPGDLILFSNTYSSSDWITHVGIYIGDGKMVHAANSKRGITVDSIVSGYYHNHYAGARRILTGGSTTPEPAMNAS